MKHVMATLALLAVPCAALADEVRLVQGGKIVGVACERGDRVVVEMAIGTVAIPRSEVVEIVRERTVLHEYHERLANIGQACRMESLFDLVAWAQARRLSRQVGELLRRVIELDPDHADARAMLGHVRLQGRWISLDECAKELDCVAVAGKAPPLDLVATARKSGRARTGRRVEATPYALGLPPYADRGARSVDAGYTNTWFDFGPMIGFSTQLRVSVRR